MIYIKSPEEIEIMTEGGKRLAGVLRTLEKEVRIGMSTKQVDDMAYELIASAGCIPSFLNYQPAGAKHPYPATICISLNDVIVHGTPSPDRIIKDGDVVKLDLGLIYKKFHLDAARTVLMGNVTDEAKRLAVTTRKALAAGIKEAKPGNTLGDIGFAINAVVQKEGFSVAEGLVGHGVGHSLHEDPADRGRHGARH
jgi:methionyl aminopeptidase